MAISIAPESGPPGTEVRITGRGAPPGATVRVLAASWPEPIDCRTGRGADLIAEVPANASGEFTATHRAERVEADQVGYTYVANVVLNPSEGPPVRELTSNQACFRFSEVDGGSEPAFFPQTGFRIDHGPFAEYFRARGGVETFGYPVSRTVTFLGCRTQFFQRHLLQQCGDGPVQPMNLLDPGLMQVNRINGSIFPEHSPEVAQSAPSPQAANYGQAVANHIAATVPNTFQGLPVEFYEEFVTAAPDNSPLVALEIWGFPTSRPAFDPNNRNFVYQRFQRGIMHFDQRTGATGGILMGDWFKSVITGQDLPQDLAAQMQGSRFLRQYCPDQPRGLCRPGELPETDLSQAFEPVQSNQRAETRTLPVFFSRRPDSLEGFDAVFPVERTVTVEGQRVATPLLEELIEGPTPAEQERGYFSELEDMLRGESNCGGRDFLLRIDNGLAEVRFCRQVVSAGIGQDARVTSQIENTLEQFETVDRVRLLNREGRCLFDPSGLNRC